MGYILYTYIRICVYINVGKITDAGDGTYTVRV